MNYFWWIFLKQEGPKHLVGLHNYTEVNADPAQINSVRMRTRILKKYCSGSLRWSDWSDPVKVCECCLFAQWLSSRFTHYCLRVWIHGNITIMISVFVLCVCSNGTASFPTQSSGDHFHLPWNTHDPPGCAAVCALSEVLAYPAARCATHPSAFFFTRLSVPCFSHALCLDF